MRMRVGLGSLKARSFCFFAFVLAVLFVSADRVAERKAGIKEIVFSMGNRNMSRKLLHSNDSDENEKKRIGQTCSKEDIVIYQGKLSPLPKGIPSYTVQIMNICASDCSISKIHLHCGWFSSARLINPRLFRRVGYDDCLVNEGRGLAPGRTISFQYTNTYPYPLSVSSVKCCLSANVFVNNTYP